MRTVALMLSILFILISCSVENENRLQHDVEDVNATNENFKFVKNKPCKDVTMDNYVLGDSSYIMSKTSTELEVEIEFNSACCQEFAGNYSIKNDTLVFEYFQSNDVMCSCYCRYSYSLFVYNEDDYYREVVVRKKTL